MVAKNPLSIDELKPGMMIVQIEQQNGPVKLRKSGLVKSYDMVKGLKEMGVLSLIIDWENSLEIDTSSTSVTPTNTVVQTNTRQLFNDEEQSVNNAMSDQFNRSLFLPSLQALPSQFSVWSRYAIQYIGVSVIGLGIGIGSAHLLSSPIDSSNSEMISTKTRSSEQSQSNPTPDIALTKAITNVRADEEPAFEQVEQIKQVEPIALQETNKPEPEPEPKNTLNIDDINGGTLVTQRTGDNISTSPIIAAKVNEALAQLGGLEELTQAMLDEPIIQPMKNQPSERETTVEVVDNTPRVSELPEHILVQLPAMVFSAHMFSSNDEDRWVRVNNRRLQEGGSIDNNVTIIKIEPQFVVLSFRGTQFRMNALTDW